MSVINKRNPFAVEHDFMGGVRTSFEISRDVERDAEDRPLRISFSVGTGRGNSKPEMSGDEFCDLVGFICDGDLVSLSLSTVLNGYNLTPADISARTLVMGDGTVNFKVSSQSGARTIKVPVGQWGVFTSFLSDARDALESERDLIWPVAGPEVIDPTATGEDVHVEDEDS